MAARLPASSLRRRLVAVGAALCLLAALPFAAEAQLLDPVKWTFLTERNDDGTATLVYRAAIDEGWYVYSQYLESDDGPQRTEITYDDPAAVELLGSAEESGKRKEGFDKLFGMNVVKFADRYEIRQRVRFAGDAPARGYVYFMTCDDTRCLPPTEVDFAFAPPVSEASAKTPAPPANLKSAKAREPAIVAAVEEARAEEDIVVQDVERPKILAPVSWSFSVRPADGGAGDEYLLRATAQIEPGWTVYAQDVPEGGPVATSFDFADAPGYERLGRVVADGKRKSGYDNTFGMEVTKYLAPVVTFSQRVRVAGDAGTAVVGWLEFMTCDDAQCLPPREVFFRYVPARGLAEEIDYETYEALAAAASGSTVAAADVPGAGGEGEDPLTGYAVDKQLEGATCGNDTREVVVAADAGLWKVFLLGFGGGLLALLTPCVFPMIPLTVSFFTGGGKDRARGLRRALIYGASIIGIYVSLGLVITGVFGADALNQLSTNAFFNVVFGVLFLVFALSFFGFFEIQLPSSWANKTDRAADRGGLAGIFFMAFTLSLVSFSCTGPIIGSLLVETATGGGATVLGRIPVAPLVGMFAFSLALALPFTLFAAFPSALASLPKSGGWMNHVKVTLGFAEVALAMKFLSTADLIMGTKWLPYELFLGVWVLCALGLAAYYFGLLRTPLDAHGGGAPRGPVLQGLGVLSLAFALYLAAGFRYDAQSEAFATPLVLSGLAPPAGHSYVYPKKCPQNLDCFKDLDAGLAFAKTAGKPVLIDFTGHGCVNCRKMEDNVWGEEGVYERLRDDYVLVSLYVDEREALDEPFESSFSGRTIRTVGAKWADFQARYFNRNSQPYYVLASPDLEVLNQPVPYTPDVAEYAAFLECGLQQYGKLRRGELPGEDGLSAVK